MADLVVKQQLGVTNALHGSNKREWHGRLTHPKTSLALFVATC